MNKPTPWPASPVGRWPFYAGLGVRVERLMTDNGSGYRSAVFGQVLADAGVTHKRTRPYRPCTNGKAERLNLDDLATWLHHYNHHRPHRALGGRSPMQLLNNLPGSHS
jgi:transposase InsO family protein